MTKGFKILIVIYCICICNSLFAAEWFNVGPGGGGGIHRPSISPFNSDIMAASCDMGGYYITTDAGKHWLMMTLPLVVQFTVFDYKDRKIVYIGSDKVYKSGDYGKNLETFVDSGVLGGQRPLMMSIDPDNPDSMFIAAGRTSVLYSNKFSKLITSSDGGKNWETCGQGLPAGIEIFRDIFIDRNSPKNKRIIYIGTGIGVYKSEDNGRNFVLVSNGLSQEKVFKIAGGCDLKAKRTVVYLYDTKNVYKTENGANTWEKIEESLESQAGENRSHIVVSLSNPDIVYVASYSGDTQDIYKSIDAGKTWDTVFYPENADCGWLTKALGFYNPYPIRELGISPADPQVVLFTNDALPVCTIDGGETWQQLASTNKFDDYWTGNGIEVTTCYGVFFDPKDPKRMYIAYTDMGAFKSVDAGKSWKYIGNHWNTFYWIEIDPANPEKIWGAVSRMHDLPQSKMLNYKVTKGDILISNDAGESWTTSTDNGLPGKPVTSIVLDPASKSSARILYATVWTGGIYKSLDGGKSWKQKNNGISESLNAWRIIRTDDNTLYAVFVKDITGNGGWVYKSVDSGESWTKLNVSLPFPYVLDIAVSPEDKNTLYLCGFISGSNKGGVYRSTNGGIDWKRVLEQEYILGLTVDKRNPDLIYAAYCNDDDYHSGRGIYVSKNRGDTWENIGDIPFVNTYRVSIHPEDLDWLYVTTFGGGVFTNKIPKSDTK